MRRFWVWLAAFSALFFTTNSVAAQCGNYFKANYRAINKFEVLNPALNSGPYLLADWTGDGRLDYWNFRRNSSNATNDIVIFPAKATGYWDWDNPIVYSTSIQGPTNTLGIPFYVKDFNSDGRVDLHFLDRIYQNNGSGGLTTLAQIFIPNSPLIRIGYFDINGDGLLDILDQINAPGGGNSLAFYPGNADGSFGAAVTFFTSPELLNLAKKMVADFNGDGRVDIVYGTAGGYRVFINAGNGTFTTGNLIQPVNGVMGFRETKDFNADGRADILGVGGSPRKLVIFYGQANGTFTETAQTIAAPEADTIKIGELNGDSHPDIFEIAPDHYNTYINNGSGVFTVTSYQKHMSTGIDDNGTLFQDFSGDGKTDLLGLYYNNFGEPIVVIHENVCQAPGGETKRLNFDGDVVSDYALWNQSTGEWISRNSDYSGVTGPVKTFIWGSGSLGDVPAPGDFDGDGKTDYSVFRGSTGTWYIFLSASSSWYVLPFGLPGDVAVPNDYDGGGKTDIAVWRPADGNWYIWYSETQSFGGIHFGAEGDKPVPSDYDGDGKTDVAVYRPSEGGWYYLKSSDGAYSVYQWGIATDKPLPADYDGDGKSDLTVFRDGVWYVWRSSNNTFAYIFWGTATDIPLISFMGELFADPVVYRDSLKAFYNNRHWWVTSFPVSQNVPVYFGLPNN